MTTVLINSEFYGRGSEALGARLMGAFLRTLAAAERKPEVMIFVNSGVKLLAGGSPVLDAVEALLQAGVDIAACGTCVAHFELADRLAAGRVSNMQEIASLLMDSERTVTV